MFWSFFMQFLLFTSAFSKHGGNDTDRLSLLEFKAKVIDPLGVLNSWNESLHFCMWQGVTCGRRHKRVTILDVHSSQLGGYISPHVGNLSFLRRLDLVNNSFSHEIPEAIGRLFRLQVLFLGNNSLSGTIPVNISRCSNLQFLYLAGNNLTGKIPKGMDSLSLLEKLYFGWNNLDGEIPSSICNLSKSLEQFSLEINNLHGSIPKCFDQLKRLVRLAIGGNNLSGTIPPSMYNLSSIQKFSLHTNRFQGNLPPNLGHLLPNLESFLFHTNQFTGPFPIISNASNLVFFEILDNYFTGKVPDFSSLPNLMVLWFGMNNLGYGKDGDLNFLFSLINCTNLETLSINDNNFGGVLPKYISNFSTTLSSMVFGRNQIKGSIPTGIGNLVNLQKLGLEENQLVGNVPSSLGKLKKLYVIALQDNKLSGSIPSSLGNLTSMGALDIRNNNFQGILPSSLGECKNLVFLYVSQNNLSGPLPKEVIGLPSLSIYLGLSQNQFTGSIPKEVGNMVRLGILDISENKLSGEIPETLGGCESLEYLSLAGNLLQGSIPQSFDSLKAIEEIDLSRNNLSGRIPTYMIGFRSLKILNLSFNNFEGKIPTQGIFTNTSGLSVVGNEGLCGGIPQLHLPKCPSTSHNKHKHLSSKQKLAVLVACGLVGAMLLVLSLVLLCWTRTSKGKSIFGSPFGISLLDVSYKDLVKATSGFSSENLLGCGSFGSVYKGTLNPEKNLMVAVKVFNLNTSRAFKSFMAECKVLKSIRHRNLVKILTACSSIDFQGNDFKALVYEFMINGSLEEWLHPSHGINYEQARHLSLTQRINIAIDVANALDYMHHHCHVPIVHSDIKPSNILLDGDMTARVGDFGLARFLNNPSHLFSSYESGSIGIRGSIGYIAPEYVMGGELSREGDVYSYGILLLEMFTGKRPTDDMFKDDFNLHNFVKMSLPERIAQAVDSALPIGTNQVEERPTASEHGDMEIDRIEEININDFQSVQNCHLMLNTNLGKALHSVLKIGIACSEKTSTERMNIGDVIKELQHVKAAYMELKSRRTGGQELAK